MEQNDNILASIVRFAILVYRVIFAYIDACLTLFRQPSKKCISGQNVLITGAGHGLGRELAHRLADLGANLALVDINEANNEKVKQEILAKWSKRGHHHQQQQQGDKSRELKVFAYSVDIRTESNVAGLAKRVQSDLGDIDILINNAGIVQCLPFLELKPELVERVFQVNTLAHLWTARHFLPKMIENKRGHIVAISSIAGLIASKYLTDYCASKFAVVGFMDALDREIHDGDKNPGVHLTTVCPVCMSTGMFQTFRSRFSWLLPVLDAGQVADGIVSAMLANRKVVVIPPIALFFHRLSSIVPTKANELVQDYMDYGVKPHAH